MKQAGLDNTFQQEIEAIAASVHKELELVNAAHALDLQKAIREDPYKLFYFSVRVINAVANSFMGVPAAAIIIAADRILAGTLVATLSTPDKIFILLLASAILMTFLTLAYKSEARTSLKQELSISITQLVNMTRVLSLPDKTIKQAIDEARCEKMIIAIRNGQLLETDIEAKTTSDINTLFARDPILQILINNEIILRPEAAQNPELYRILYRALYVPNTISHPQTLPPPVSNYINMIRALDHSPEDPKRWELVKSKLQNLLEKLTLDGTYQKRFSTIGNTLGNVNALVNGILTCSFGIGGLTAFFVLFMPGFTIPLMAAIPIGIVLFIAGTIHSGSTTKSFIQDSFAKLGLTIDKERLSYPNHTFSDWLKFAAKKISDNKKSLLIAGIASATVTGLCILATLMFFSTLPLSTPLVMGIVITVALLTWVSALNSFNAVLMQKAQADHDRQWYIEKVLTDEDRQKLNTAKQVKTFHALISCMITVVMLAITVPLMSSQLGLLTPIMISGAIGMISYLATALFNSRSITDAQEPNEKNALQVFNYRFRIMVSILLGASFALTAGPTLAVALINALPMLSGAAAMPLAITFGMVVAASLYYVMPLVYWDIALKPSYGIALGNTDSLTPSSSTDTPSRVPLNSPHNGTSPISSRQSIANQGLFTPSSEKPSGKPPDSASQDQRHPHTS
jgi:hypothetical protein